MVCAFLNMPCYPHKLYSEMLLLIPGVHATILDNKVETIAISPSPNSMLVFEEIKNCKIPEPYSRIFPSQPPTLNGGLGVGCIFVGQYHCFSEEMSVS